MVGKTEGKQFVERFKLALTACGVDYLSPTAVGSYLGLNKQTVARWLVDGEPSPEMLFKIADKMRVNPRWLATNEGSPKTSVDLAPAEQDLIEQIYRQLQSKARAKWVRDGHELVELTTQPGAHNPYSKVPR